MKFYDCQTAPSPRRARIFIAEKSGTITVFQDDASTTISSVFLDVSSSIITDGETGLLVPHGDEAGLASALGSLLADEGRAAGLARAARQRFTESFTHERMVSAYVEVYRELLSRRDG